MLGERAIELVKEATRAQDAMGPFNEDKVRKVLEEMRVLVDANQKEVEEKQTVSPAIQLRHSAIERNKRCLLAYINQRAEQITEMRWQFGAVVPQEIRANLCEPEQAFFATYGRDLAKYMQSIGDGIGLDLLNDLQPPRGLYISVRCNQDYGEIESEEGEVYILKKNAEYYMPRSLCEPLIRQAILEHVSN